MRDYGSIDPKQNEDETEIQLSIDLSDPFGEKDIFANEEFWKECRQSIKACDGRFSNEKCQMKTRAQWLLRKHAKEETEMDLIYYLLTVVHDEYAECALKRPQDELHYPTFLYELSELVLAILEIDNEGDEKYNQLIFPTSRSPFKCSILHLAAERSLTQIIKYAVEFYPKLGNKAVNIDDEDYYPLHFLLEKKDQQLEESVMRATDESANFLISVMENDRVRLLFESSDRELASFKFKDFIIHGGFNKTCIALLDCLMDPCCPFIKKYADTMESGEEGDETHSLSSGIPNVPVRYHFFYQILDGDDLGQAPMKEDGSPNENFNFSSKSCLQLLAENSSKEEAIKHPVVRSLVRYKWKTYARNVTYAHAFMYALFMVLLAVSLFTQPTDRSPTTYEGAKDYFRMVCEIGALFFTLIYFVAELHQLFVERLRYFHDFFNYMDILGMLCIICIVPLRFTKEHQAELIISGAGFFINFLRIVKFFPASETLGVYSKTIARIIYYDVSKFMVIFLIVMFSFTGMVYLFLLATKSLATVDGGFWGVFLKETQTLAEASPFSEDYTVYKNWVIIILMLNMLSILVILLNILIGQISYRYEEALGNASISYDIDRCILVAKSEHTSFKNFMNFRVKHFKKADFVSNEEVAEELVEDWMETLQLEKMEKRRKAIRMFSGRKGIKKRSMKQNPTSVSLVAPD